MINTLKILDLIYISEYSSFSPPNGTNYIYTYYKHHVQKNKKKKIKLQILNIQQMNIKFLDF